MIILFKKPVSMNDFKVIHDCYFMSGEPDAPMKPFDDLTPEEKERICSFSARNSELVFCQRNVVGFITVVEIEEGLNLGGALLPKYQGRELVRRCFKKNVENLKVGFLRKKYLLRQDQTTLRRSNQSKVQVSFS